MKRQSVIFFTMLLFLGASLFSCKNSALEPIPNTNNNGGNNNNANEVCFERDVLPILQSSCGTTGCHDAASHRDGVTLINYASVMAGSELVRPFSASNSELVEVLTETGDDLMPPFPASPLSSTQIATIIEWINNGATNDVCTTTCDATIFTFSGAISEIMTNNCKGCHSGNSPSGGVSISNYNELKAIADDGRLVETLKAINGRSLMPPANSLDDCQIQQIENWIAAGTNNDWCVFFILSSLYL